MLKLSFSWSKTNQNVILRMQFFFEFWHVEKDLIQNLTRCKTFRIKIMSLKKQKNAKDVVFIE